jgi:hypothetical protein
MGSACWSVFAFLWQYACAYHRLLVRHVLQDDVKALLATNEEAVFAGVRGQAYEAYVHRSYSRLSGPHDLQRLLLGGGIEECKLDFGELKQQQMFHDPAELKGGVVHGVPHSRTFAAVDSVIGPALALQVTVSAHHGFKAQGLKDLKAALRLTETQPLRVVLVSPPDVVGKVLWQPLTRGKTQIKKPRGLEDGKGLFQYRLSFAWQ